MTHIGDSNAQKHDGAQSARLLFDYEVITQLNTSHWMGRDIQVKNVKVIR